MSEDEMSEDELDLTACYERGLIRASCPPCRTHAKINEDIDKFAPVPEWIQGYPKERERIAKLESEWEDELKRRSNIALPKRT
jgi:hypothetical protein